MNKSELIGLIKEPEKLGKQEIALLNRVAADFPYFQGVQVLLTRSYANLKHYEFDKQLHKAALTVPNREVLYRYLQGEMMSATEEMKQVAPDDLVIQQEVEAPVQPNEHDLAEIVYSGDETEISVPDATLMVEPASTEVVNVQDMPSTASSEDQLWSHAGEYHTFAEWLAYSKGKKPEPEKEEQKEILEPQEFIKVDEMREIAPEPVNQPVAKSNVPAFDGLLDKFIRESPSISRPKAEFYNPANMAKQSVEEDEDLVSETLAKLYEKQGHHKKAIRAYEKLCLIYPHKMAYFADLILKIKQEHKD